ncbi:hypothetical protein VNI00_002153 [Paramarasmius palmivorus]|uniref:Protein kinase domain-containing protein n=1 Tax=Paramarasmius palmivorus TaxID=297713 RepID=A0AAW0E427_9AGAR
MSTSSLELRYNSRDVVPMYSNSSSCLKPQLSAYIVKPLGGQVYLGLAGPKGKEPSAVALKLASGHMEVQRLKVEADIYQKELVSLQGTLVPKFYGIYTSEYDGVKRAVMILEHCGDGKVSEFIDFNEFNRLLMLAACKLHRAGVVHGSLDEPRHILEVGKTIRIIDFADVGRYHQCVGAVPRLESNHRVPMGCVQLEDLENRYGSLEMKGRHAHLISRSKNLRKTAAALPQFIVGSTKLDVLGANWGWKNFPGLRSNC